MITLREDQDKVLAGLRQSMRANSSTLVYAPTGFGKTVLASAIIQRLVANGKRVIFAVHRLALIKQTAVTFAAFDIFFSYIANGFHYNPYPLASIASIDTLKNRLGKYKADYLFIDEAHLAASEGWAKTINHYREAGCKIIGMSGSPQRLDGKPLGDVFDDMVMGPSPKWLIQNGFLSRYRAFAPEAIKLDGLRKHGKEFDQKDLDDALSDRFVVAGAIDHWRARASGQRTVLFAHSVKQAGLIAEQFTAAGHRFVALDGNTPQAERDKAFNALADRKIDGIANCNLFAEGFDMSAQVGRDVPIECVVDMYPTLSLPRHLQRHGRGLRRKPHPATLLDLCGGFKEHGLPDEEREWSLTGRETNGKPKKDKDEERVRICERCGASHEPAPTCPHCGYVYPVQVREIDTREANLVELDPEEFTRRRKQEQGQAKSLEDLIKLATARGYKSPEKWAAHVYTARQAKRTGT